MNHIKLNRSLVSLITGGVLLAASSVSRADTILNIEQPIFNSGINLTIEWPTMWQSFTTPDYATTITGIEFPLSPAPWAVSMLNRTATVSLLSGEGSVGGVLTQVTGRVIQDTSYTPDDPNSGYFLAANFGNVNLSPDQKYTVYLTNPSGTIGLSGFSYSNDVYAAGRFYSAGFGPAEDTATWDLAFFIPNVSANVAAVPEPSSLAMLLIGLTGFGGYAARKHFKRS